MKNEKLPHYLKAIIVSDPELVEILRQNRKDENSKDPVIQSRDLKTALTGVLLGTNSFEMFKKILPDLTDEKDFSLSFLKECLYLAVPFLGIASVYPFLKEVAKFIGKNELSVSKPEHAVSDKSSQKELRHLIFEGRTAFGISVNDATPSFKRSIDEFVFRKFYERTLLSYRSKELLSLFIVFSSKASAQALTEHVNAALKTGNTKEELLALIENTAVFSGYIRASEAIRAVKNAKKVTVITSLDKDFKSEEKKAYEQGSKAKSSKKVAKHSKKTDGASEHKSKKKDRKSDDKKATEDKTEKMPENEDKTVNDSKSKEADRTATLHEEPDITDNTEKSGKKNTEQSKQKNSRKK